MPSILILEDDITFSLMLKTWLGRKGFEVSSVSSVSDARSRIEDASFDLILSDLRLPDGDGIDLLKWIKENNFVIPLIMMTSYAEIQTAVQAIKLGASDYIAKPLNPEELLGKIKDVIKTETGSVASATELERPTRSAKRPEPSGGTRSQYVEGQSQAARQLYEHVRLVAPTDMSVLITGSSGTGKEYVARRIHEQSNRKKAPFIAVDCGAIPKDLAASEFFGHVKGSFTGALADRKGYFEEADGGTIFLDEVGELPLTTQARLLRVLESGEFIKVGSSKVQKTNVRIVAATNVNMIKAISEGKFREDLFYRLNTVPIELPPLRDRMDDILLLFRKFSNDFAEKYRMPAIQLTDDAKNLLLTYRWPGNIRQLKNVTEQISIFETSREVSADIIKSYLPSYNVERLPVVSGSEGKDGFLFGNEREMLYQIIFEMRKEMNELKSIVDNLAASENGHGLKVYTPEHNTAITHPTVPVVKTFHIDKESTEDVHDESVFEETSLSLEDAEKEMIRKSLERNNGKRKKTAEELKISERTLYRKIKEYNLE